MPSEGSLEGLVVLPVPCRITFFVIVGQHLRKVKSILVPIQ
jgi:hypothetical protein